MSSILFDTAWIANVSTESISACNSADRVDLAICPDRADTRDTEAVKRIATAYLKLLYPNARSAEEVNVLDFNRYCLKPATKMRYVIKKQLGILDKEFKGKDIPKFTIKEIYYDK